MFAFPSHRYAPLSSHFEPHGSIDLYRGGILALPQERDQDAALNLDGLEELERKLALRRLIGLGVLPGKQHLPLGQVEGFRQQVVLEKLARVLASDS